MHVHEDRPTREQLDGSWDQTFERLRTFIAARVGDDNVAADIAQDVLVRNIAAGALEGVDNPTAWLYRSRTCREIGAGTTDVAKMSRKGARNAVIDHYRTRHPHDPLDELADRWPEPEPVDDRPNAAVRDLAGCLRPLAAQLPDIYREALDRVDLAGQSHHDAAVELGLSTSGMKSRVQRARRQLKDLLTGCCAVQVDRLGAVSSYRPNAGSCGCPGSD